MQAVTSEQMAEIDRRAQQDYGIPGLLLMEQAGLKGFGAVKELYGLDSAKMQPNLVFLAGGGNNGGDALVMAREALQNGFSHITVVLMKKAGNERVELHRRICEKLSVAFIFCEENITEIQQVLQKADFIFDGIMGTGLTGELRSGIIRDVVDTVNTVKDAKVIAVDIPSGLSDRCGNSAHYVHADCTITFGLPKLSCYYPHTRMKCGIIKVVNPGFPIQLLHSTDAYTVLPENTQCSMPEYPAESYKNSKGHTAVFAGSVGYTGAAVLAAEAALRSRSGLVTLFVDQSIYPITASRLSSVIVKPVAPDSVITSRELASEFSACALGPGWGKVNRVKQLKEIVDSGLPSVFDADALSVLKQAAEEGAVRYAQLNRAVFTPHPGELQRLTGYRISEKPQDLYTQLLKASKKFGCVLLCKSFINYVSTPEGKITILEGLNPAMGTAGSGDVLTGIIGSLLAQNYSPEDAAVQGTLLHQRAGRLVLNEFPGCISEDLLKYLSRIS